ncbi:MAG: DUF1552 domain-containing protein [Phycisphaeraceae bacterium]
MKRSINRRHFLRGAGALIALPALESIGFRPFTSASALAAPTAPPKRMVFMGIGYGVTSETWFPDIKDKGAGYKLPEGLKPLARHKDDFTIVQGCKHHFSRQAHWGSTYWLTGANQFGTPGQSFSNTISADQVAAAQFGEHTRFTSIQLASDANDRNGHGPGSSLAWDQRGKPLSAWNSPLQTYLKLFGADDMPLAQRRAMLAEQRSVLDSVRIEAKDMQKGLTKTDTDKLDEYFQSIRDIETRLSKAEKWMDVPKSEAPLEEPDEALVGRTEIEMMYKLIVAAIQTDSTRVLTYREPGSRLLTSLGANGNAHNVSHYRPGSTSEEASKMRDKAHSELLAGLIDQLKATKEADGSSLFDHVALAFGSNIRSIHYLNNPPTLITGGGANLKLGQNLVLNEGTPLNNVWLTMLQGVGVKVERHGDSTGVVKELQA